MRITRDLLQRVAEDTVADRVKRDTSIVAAYLHGTVLEGEDPAFLVAFELPVDFPQTLNAYTHTHT